MYEVHGLLIKHIIYCMRTNYDCARTASRQLPSAFRSPCCENEIVFNKLFAICSHCMEAATDHGQAPGGRNTDCVCLQDNSSNLAMRQAGVALVRLV